MGKVSFHHVHKKYPGERRYSVRDFHLEVHDGEFLVLVGPSGCGKSTLLRMLAGLEEITEGEIYIGDRMVNYVSSKDRDIAMVFQNYALYPHMKVYENIAFGLRLRKMAKHEIHERVMKAARILEISHLLDKIPRNMSGGQRQRVALGRAIVREPQVFLMDEPLSNLDAKLRVQMREEIMRLHRTLQTTTIYVTHDQVEAMTMGSRIVVMNAGVIQQVGTPYEIYNHPANKFVAGFIGTPPMNFIEGKLSLHEQGMFFETRRYRLLLNDKQHRTLRKLNYADKRVILGIRPEKAAVFQGEDPRFEHRQFAAEVDMLEFMGSDTYLHLFNKEHSLTVRVDPFQQQFRQGDLVHVGLDMDKVHFFDIETEELLC
jgi:multiple sugar transport system ATP-binding protein